MCGINIESLVTQIVVAALGNEKFFENMTMEEKVKAVPALYSALYNEMLEPTHAHNHEHEHK
jgi:hypothetical protein